MSLSINTAKIEFFEIISPLPASAVGSFYIMCQRAEGRKQRILHSFRGRKMPEELAFGRLYTSHPLNFNIKSKTFILNTAELATIFHVPTEKTLVAPHVKQVESKKMGPPAGLPIFEEE